MPKSSHTHLLFAGLRAWIPQLRQFPWVPFPRQDGSDDGQPRGPAQVADRIGQLHIHGRQRLLRVFDRPAGFLHAPLSQPPQGAYGADLLRGPERIPQQLLESYPEGTPVLVFFPLEGCLSSTKDF